MKKDKKHHQGEEKRVIKKEAKTPVQPDEPVGEITSSGNTARFPERDDTPADEQTKGNP